MLPPVTDKNAAPQKPVTKRKTISTADRCKGDGNQEAMSYDAGSQHVPTLGAKATGQEKIKKPVNDTRYIIFRPERKFSVP